MSETENAFVVDAREQADEMNLGDSPYIYSPYPDRIMQVEDARTRGESRVIELINDNWPEDIETLERLAEEEYDGYSGSFIRSVLRNRFAPQDMLSDGGSVAQEEPVETEESNVTADELEDPIDDTWHKIFRMGLRVALQEDISREEAEDAFMSGIIEGEKLNEEMSV